MTGLMGVFTVVKEENLLGIGVEFLEEFEISFIALLTSLTWMFKALTSYLSFLTSFSSSDVVSAGFGLGFFRCFYCCTSPIGGSKLEGKKSGFN